jgi:site-specific recombinase XerD
MFIFKRNKYYHLEYTDEDGRLRRISTGEKKKKDALDFLSKFERGIKRNSKLIFITLEQFQVKYYTYTYQTMSKNYCRNIESSFKLLAQHFEGETPLKNIKMNQLESIFLKKFQKAKFSSALTYRTLKSAFQKAVQWNYITHNPINQIKLPKIPKNHPLFIDTSEFELLLSNEPDDTLKHLYTFAFYTGLRRNEIVHFQW